MDEKNCEVEQLRVNLKSSQDKLLDVLRELECRTKERDQLNEDFKCIQIKLAEVKECAARTKENLTLELETLSNDLKNKSNILNEMDVQYNKVKCEINSEKYTVRQLTENLAKFKKEKEYDEIELKNEIVRLKKENCLKKDDIHNLKKKIEKLNQKNRCHVLEINSLKLELEEMKCQLNLKPMSLLPERMENENQTPNFRNDLKTESITDKCTPNTITTNTTNGKIELNSLTCELENLKRDLGIDFVTQKL